MSIPNNFYIDNILEQVVQMMYDDLKSEFEFDPDEPTYVGLPIFMSNYPCLVSIPSYTGVSSDQAHSPFFGKTTVQHTIIYVFKGMRAEEKDFVDPALMSLRYGQRMLDWVAYANLIDRLPLVDIDGDNVDSNWAADQYQFPWTLSIKSEYEDALRQHLEDDGLHAPCVTFNTIWQRRFV